MKTEQIAKAAHEVNRAFCIQLGDYSHLPWDEAPDWQKASAIKGVEFKLANPKATPEQQHIEWLRIKDEDGWRYGPKKDAQKKTHPCFLPYDELPPEQRAKDTLFATVVEGLR
jgi:hypothetical protein